MMAEVQTNIHPTVSGRARTLCALGFTTTVVLGSEMVSADTKALLEPTTAMIEHAEKIGALSNVIATQFEKFRASLDADCAAGNTDSCFAASELRQEAWVPNLSPSPGAANRQVAQNAAYLGGLCRRHQRSACHRLGRLIFLNEGVKDVYSLSTRGGLAGTVEQVLEGDGVPIRARKKTTAEIIAWLKEGCRLSRSSTGCVSGNFMMEEAVVPGLRGALIGDEVVA